MVQGPQLGPVAIVETMRVEALAIQQELRPHDAREVWLLNWNRRAVAVYGDLVEAHGSTAQKEIHRRHLRVASELEARNEFEDGVHAGMFAEVLAG